MDTMHKKIMLLLLIFFPISGYANWNVISKIDDFTDDEVKFASYNDDHHHLQINRNEKTGYVWFFIKRKDIGSFEPNTIIEMRVDKNKVKEIDPKFLKRLSSSVGQTFYQWEPNTIAFSVWHGKEDKGKKCGFISDLLTGDTLKIRYRVSTLETNSINISLNGAKDSLIEALDLKVCGKL